MRIINKSFFSIVFFVACINAYSQSFILNLPPTVILQETDISLEEDDEDEISLDSLMNLSASGIMDSIGIPAARLYNYVWNNQFVNPYKMQVTNMPDTIRIDISQYCHPNRNVVTSDFGFRRGVRFHYGVDTRLKVGDSICSSFDGMVRIVMRGRAYGNYIVIRHFNGLETVYAHLSKTLVNVNQIVRAGEIIGLGGNTGRSTGPHLHYEMRYLGNPISPRSLIDFENYTPKNRIAELCASNFNYVKEIDKIRFYTVRKGDTLSGISKKVGISVEQICRLNKMKKTTPLRIGQRIKYS